MREESKLSEALDTEIRREQRRLEKFNTASKETLSDFIYNQSQRGKERNQRYESSEKGKERQKRYNESEKGKERLIRYREKKKQQAVQKTPQEKNKESCREYRAFNYEKERERNRLYYQEHREERLLRARERYVRKKLERSLINGNETFQLPNMREQVQSASV